MDKSQWASFRAALKTLDAGPRKIAQARAEYAEADKYMQEHKRSYSEIGQERYYQTARTKRDAVINGEVSKLAKALETVREFRTFPGEVIDLGSVKLQNALSIINMLGKKLPPDQQLSFLEEFRGQPAALNFLGTVYDEIGLFYGSYARELAKPVSTEALDNMQYAIDSFELLGKWPEEKLYWTQNAFSEAATRLGLDVTDGRDIYIEALKSARDGQSESAQRLLSQAIVQIQNGAEYLTDAQKAEIFNNVVAKVTALADNAEAQEIYRQATTQDNLDTIRAAAASANVTSEGGAD